MGNTTFGAKILVKSFNETLIMLRNGLEQKWSFPYEHTTTRPQAFPEPACPPRTLILNFSKQKRVCVPRMSRVSKYIHIEVLGQSTSSSTACLESSSSPSPSPSQLMNWNFIEVHLAIQRREKTTWRWSIWGDGGKGERVESSWEIGFIRVTKGVRFLSLCALFPPAVYFQEGEKDITT